MNNRETWRLILHPPYPGAWNMSIDEALLESVSAHKQPPTLRLYDWFPYALSLGYAQTVSDINPKALKLKGWELVRRPTGGRAILHADELTYSITAPINNPILHGTVIESYHRISTALIGSLRLIGINAGSKLKNKNESHLSNDPACFRYPSDYEITYDDKKIIGSAQARKKGGILQHGSIPLFGEITRIIEVLNYPSETAKQDARQNLANRATTIESVLGHIVSWSQMAEAIREGFQDNLNVKFSEGNLTREELKNAQKFYQEKYNLSDWTYRI